MKLKTSLILALLAVSSWRNTVAQQITPVWEYLINKPGVPIPILTNSINVTADEGPDNGQDLMDSFGPLVRYDANRLLFGIRDNGINEAAAGPKATLAAEYPDRSLLWINPTNGAPMGIALNIGLHPVPLDADFIAAGGTPDQYWWTYDVSKDGFVYTGYKNKILRYGPDGKGGISTNPVVVFTLTMDDLSNHNADTSFWAGWRWARLRVTGTGANTVILAGGTSKDRGNFLLTTTDGSTFTAGSYVSLGGATATPIPSRDPATPDDLWVYAGVYPGNSSGVDSSFGRYTASAPFTDSLTSDTSFKAPSDPFTYPEKYRAEFTGGLDASKDLNYVVVYSTPSFNSRSVLGENVPRRPGWLALNSHDGRFLSAHKIDITEDAELLPDDQASTFQGTLGYVSLNTLTNGDVEVLWSGAIYGYGRYLIKPYGPEPVVSDVSRPPGPFPGNTVGAANWIASGSSTFDTTASIGLEGQGPIPWSMSRYNRGDFAVRLSPLDPVAAQDNFDVLQDFTGSGQGDIPSEQAWRPNSEAGVIIPTVRANGPIDWNDGEGPFYPVVAASVGGSSGFGYNMVDGTFGSGNMDIQTGKAGDQSARPSPEANFNFATTWFPYAPGWIGGAVDNPDASGNPRWASTNSHSAGLETNAITWSANGSATLSLPGVNALNDGMLFVTSTEGGSAVKVVSAAPKADGSGWIVSAHAASVSDPTVLATGQSQFQFVYIPYNTGKLIGGYIATNGTSIKSQGSFTLTRASAGTYNLAISGKGGTNGVLLLQNANFITGRTDMADNNFLSYQYQDNGNFVIQSRRTGADGTYPLIDTSFYFAWIDFTDPVTPAVSVVTPTPSLSITRAGGAATIT